MTRLLPSFYRGKPAFRRWWVALIMICHSSLLFGQGTAFTYQGQLNDGSNPANGSYDFQFVVFDNSTNGNQQGPILTNAATAVSNGLFTVTLDFGNQFPGANRWLQISVCTNGAGSFITLNPLQPLTPVPFAIYSTAAGSANSIAATNIIGALTGNGGGFTNLVDTNIVSTVAANGQVLTYNSATGQFYPSNVPVGDVPAGLITNQVAGVWTNASGIWNTNGTYSAFNSFGSSDNSFYAAAGNPSISGSNNEGFGYDALAFLSSGSANSAFGYGAMYLTTTGFANTAIGWQALYANTNGSYNTAVGVYSLAASTGQGNTALGYQSGWSFITGDHNLFLGDNDNGYVGPTNGGGNIFIGNNVGALDGLNSTNRLDIGGLIFGTGLSLNQQRSSGSVGIGQTNPAATLDVAGTILAENGFIGDGTSLTNQNGALSTLAPASLISSNQAAQIAQAVGNGSGANVNLSNLSTTGTNVITSLAARSGGFTNLVDTNIVSTVAANGQVLTYHSATGQYYPSNAPSSVVPAGLITNQVAGIWTNASGIWNTNGTYSAFNSLGSSDNSFYAAAGNPSVSGQYNEGFGFDALAFLASGSEDSAFGYGAMYLTTVGSENTAIGSQALFSNINGVENIAVGPQALFANTNGSYNTAVGVLALAANLDGTFNTGLGLSALQLNTHGIWNTALGAHTMLAMTTGNYNVGIGVDSLYAETNSSNTGVGVYSLANETGADNTSLGYMSGASFITGDHNLMLGDKEDYTGPTNGGGNIFIGSNIGALDGYNSTNRLDIGGLIFGTGLSLNQQRSSGSIGIGQINPAATLDVAGNILAENGFIGNGGGLTNLSASQLAGTLPTATLPGITTNVSTAGITFYITNGLIMRVSSP